MASTYEPIATTTLGSSQTTVTFSSITSSYTDLVAIVSFSLGNSTYQPILRFNSDTGSNYSSTAVSGNGSSAVSSRHTKQNGIYINPGAGTGQLGLTSGLYLANTNAITQIDVTIQGGGNFAQYSSLALYGIKA